MIFSTWLFGLFYLTVFIVYWTLRQRRARLILLLTASYVFYMTWNPWLITLIFGSTVLDYGLGLLIDRYVDGRVRRGLVTLSIAANLGILGVFKYAGFFVDSLRAMLQDLGLHTHLGTLSIILPVGVSFYTFQSLSYTIDVYRRKIRAERSFIDYALFVAFFPQLVAGPIVTADQFLPQLAEIKRFDWRRIDSGLVLFMVGLTKKIFIADNLALVADAVFAEPHQFVTRDLWLGMFCYGGQIFCDFSGYSDMAIGTARMLGFDLPLNFASPYLAVGLSDFWRRWHISLSQWLRDYLYIPLGGSRTAPRRNLMLTMLLGGLWHGASWTFVIWGGIHGVALVCQKTMDRWRGLTKRPAAIAVDPASPHAWAHRLRIAFGWALTLLVVHFAWVFFRCQPMVHYPSDVPEPTSVALARAAYFVTHLVVPARVADPTWLPDKPLVLLLLALMAAMQIYEELQRRGRRLPSWIALGPHNARPWPAPLVGVGLATWIVVLLWFTPGNTAPFIYFQF